MRTMPATDTNTPPPINGVASKISHAIAGQTHAHQGVGDAWPAAAWGLCLFFLVIIYLRLRPRALLLPRFATAGLRAFAGSTAIASISNSAPGRASCEIARVVDAGGAAMLKFRSRTSRNRPMCA